MLFVFLYFFSEKYLQFRKIQKDLLKKILGSPQISARVYLLQICSSNYVHLKLLYIILKGIGKILFVSVLRIFLICKFLNFRAVFTKKKLNFSKLAFRFPSEKIKFSLIHPTHITFQNFWRTLLSSYVLEVISKSYI